jgi:serine/threonine protein phosphatase 1
MNSIYAIGDIHGCNDPLVKLLSKLPIKENDTVVFLGDYIDRGPASKDVVDTLIHFRENHPKTVFLKGNHEEMMTNKHENILWVQNGGRETIDAYGCWDKFCNTRNFLLLKYLPLKHREFFENLELTYEEDDYFFVHAGVMPGLDLSENDEETLLWIRDSFLLSSYQWPKIIVHGHTPKEKPVFKTNREGKAIRIGIDTCCFDTNILTAVRLPDRTIFDTREEMSSENTMDHENARQRNT